MIGNFGDAEVFSFHATKAFHTAEGGAVTCNDPALANDLRRARNFGFVDFDCVGGLGTNAKMSELSAAMGLANLDGFDAAIERNRAVYRAYTDHLDGLDHVSLMSFDRRELNNFWYISLELSDDCPITRDDIVAILHAEHVLARRYFHPGCHRMAPYRTLYPCADDALPNTIRIAERILVLPGGCNVSTDDVGKVCRLLKLTLARAREIRDRLEKTDAARVNA